MIVRIFHTNGFGSRWPEREDRRPVEIEAGSEEEAIRKFKSWTVTGVNGWKVTRSEIVPREEKTDE